VQPTNAAPSPGPVTAPGIGSSQHLPTRPHLSKRRTLALLAAFLLLWLLLQAVLGIPLMLLATLLVAGSPLTLDALAAVAAPTTLVGSMYFGGVLLAAVLPILMLRRVGGPSFAALGLRREGAWMRELVFGAALGPLLFAMILALEWAFGWANVGPGHLSGGGLILGALSFTAVAVSEEVLARGYLLQLIARAWNRVAGVVVSSVVFALLHSLNPNATPAAMVALIGAGLLLAWGYVATGRLWLPIALHWSWNVAQGPIFGFPVSGLPSDALLTVVPTGPEWLTGGGFGPEAGALGVLAEATAAIIVLVWRRTNESERLATLLALAGATATAAAVGLRLKQ
jgi:uncharacterized protein